MYKFTFFVNGLNCSIISSPELYENPKNYILFIIYYSKLVNYLYF
jgi:hypothetical protein